MREHAIVVYGATGYSGRLVCEELLRSGTPFAIAGRSRDRLLALQRELGRPDLPLLAAGLDDAAALHRMAEKARVVLSCAGPFSRCGKPVQDAALSARSHFLDITGEHPYMLASYRRDEEARSCGVALINGVGFDVVPTDAAAALAAEALGERPVERVRIAFAVRGGPSLGTLRSILGTLPDGLSYTEGQWVPEAVGQHLWEAPLPQPFGRRTCISVPWGDLVTAPRTTGARRVQTFFAVPAAAVPAVRLATAALGSTLLRDLLRRGLDLLPEGPTAPQRARARSAVVAEALAQDGQVQLCWVRAGDAYAFTAAAAALCARLAARADFDRIGALTPAQAFGARALLDGLRDRGVEWGLGTPMPLPAPAAGAYADAVAAVAVEKGPPQ